jgi:hypothetical protein
MNLCLKDKEALLQALRDCGIPNGLIEVHEEAVPLIDYCGKKTFYRWNDHKDLRFKDCDKAHVIVRRKDLNGNHNDLGFYLDGDNSVSFICEYTRSAGSYLFHDEENKKLKTDDWLNCVKQRYVFHKTKNYYAGQGKTVQAVKQDGKLHIFVRA